MTVAFEGRTKLSGVDVCLFMRGTAATATSRQDTATRYFIFAMGGQVLAGRAEQN